MEESIKNKIILILGILVIILFIGTIRSCNMERKLKLTSVELDREKAVNWDAEQRINEVKKERDTLQKELEEARAAYETEKKALAQEQLVNQSLKEELEKMTKLKEALEEDLKEALVESKSLKSKKQP